MNKLKIFLALGFRPFFLLGGISGLLLIPLWLGIYSDLIPVSIIGTINPIYWHAHEMIFGFGLGIITGFLATATQNWTGIPGISGGKLGLLVVLWTTSRFMPYLGLDHTWLYAIVDSSFIVMFIIFIAKYLLAKQKKNWFLFSVLLAAFLGNSMVHLDSLGIGSEMVPGMARKGLHLGLNCLVATVILIGGRIIPFFTKNATGAAIKVLPRLEKLAYGSILIFALAQLLTTNSAIIAAVAAPAAVIHAMRWSHWGWRSTAKTPALWVLHIGYLFVVLGFILHAVEPWLGEASIQGTPATHAFAVGAIGIIVFGMITRVSLGHTGRPIIPAKSIQAAYLAMILAATVRVGGSLFLGEHYLISVVTAGLLWTAAFAAFIFVYFRILTSPRADGRPG